MKTKSKPTNIVAFPPVAILRTMIQTTEVERWEVPLSVSKELLRRLKSLSPEKAVENVTHMWRIDREVPSFWSTRLSGCSTGLEAATLELRHKDRKRILLYFTDALWGCIKACSEAAGASETQWMLGAMEYRAQVEEDTDRMVAKGEVPAWLGRK